VFKLLLTLIHLGGEAADIVTSLIHFFHPIDIKVHQLDARGGKCLDLSLLVDEDEADIRTHHLFVNLKQRNKTYFIRQALNQLQLKPNWKDVTGFVLRKN